MLECGWRTDVKEGWLMLDGGHADGSALASAVEAARTSTAAAAPPAGVERGEHQETHQSSSLVPEVGRRVRIHGLQSKPELNGMEGYLVANVSEKGRWQVQVTAMPMNRYANTFSSKCFALKPSCFTVLGHKKVAHPSQMPCTLFDSTWPTACAPEDATVRITENMNIAHALREAGRFDQAIGYFQKAIAISSSAYGPDSASIGDVYNCMGDVRCKQGNYAEAMTLFEKVLAMRVKANGETHQTVADVYMNMAVVHAHLSQLDQAVKLNQKALAIQIEILGTNHPIVGKAYNNMAIMLRKLCKYDEAIQLYNKAVSIILSSEGPDAVAMTYANMANVFRDQGKYSNAITYYRKSLEIDKRVLGADHPAVGQTYGNIAVLYAMQNQLNEAIQFHQKELAIQVKVLGEDHPYVGRTYCSLGRTLQMLGKNDEAEGRCKQALAIHLKAYGENHPEIGAAYTTMANVRHSQGNWAEAVEYIDRAAAAYTSSLGPDHEDTRNAIQHAKSMRRLVSKTSPQPPSLGLVLEVGCQVRIHGLQKKPELNGKEGKAVAEVEGNGRWQVQLSASQSFSLKPGCLNVIASALRGILCEVHADVHTFFNNLNSFYCNKKGIEALRAREVAPGILEALDVAAIGIEDSATGEYKLEYFQRQCNSQLPVQSTEDVYTAASLTLPLFEKLLNDVVGKVGAGGVEVTVAPLKGRERAERKARDDYSDRPCAGGGPAIGWVYDIVRGRFMCDSVAVIKQVVEILVKDKRVKVVLKFKNRFKKPTPSGFCDMMLQIVFCEGALVHVCEVQVHLRPIYEFDQAHESHKGFEYFRNFFEGSMETVASRLKDLENIVGPAFEAFEDDESAASVLELTVVYILQSQDTMRMRGLSNFCSEVLQLHNLAMHVLRRTLAVTNGVSGGEDQRNFANIYTEMANVLQKQGKYEEVAALSRKVSAMEVGADAHAGLSDQVLGCALQKQGKYDEAMAAFQKALTIRKEIFEETHHAVLQTQNSIAGVLDEQGMYDQALEIYQHILAIELSKKDDHVGNTYNNIAIVLAEQFKYNEAVEMHQKALTHRVKASGEDHPNVASTYDNMGLALHKLGKYDAAMECHQKALAIRVKALGETHPDVGSTYHNIARVLNKWGKHAEAMVLYKKVLAIKVNAYGEEHASVANTYSNMAETLGQQGKLQEEMKLYEKVLLMEIKVYGRNHPKVGHTYYNLAVTSGKLMNCTKAVDYMNKAVGVYSRTYGEAHRETTDARDALLMMRLFAGVPQPAGGDQAND